MASLLEEDQNHSLVLKRSLEIQSSSSEFAPDETDVLQVVSRVPVFLFVLLHSLSKFSVSSGSIPK